MRVRLQKLIHLLFLFCLACGGGTSGTSATGGNSFNKIIQGTVLTDSGQPVAEAKFELLETGQRFESDIFGMFSTPSLVSGSATLRVQSGAEKADLRLANLAQETSIVGLQIKLGEQSNSDNIELVVDGVSGTGCEGLFSAAQVIRFSGNTPPLLLIEQRELPTSQARCDVGVRIFANGAPASGTKFQLLFVHTSPDLGTVTEIETIGEGAISEVGAGSLSFVLDRESGKKGYFLLEAPLSAPELDRVGVVISLLKEVQ